MILFKDWWKLGETCSIKKYKGHIADDKTLEDLFIFEEKSLPKFTNSIAQEIQEFNEQTKEYEIKHNTNDDFLSNNVKINWENEFLCVFADCDVKEINYSKIFKSYLITFDENPTEDHMYCAVIVNQLHNDEEDETEINKKNINFKIMNVKPTQTIKLNKPKTYNDDY